MEKRINKTKSRLRRATRTRAKIKELQIPRLCISKSANHVYAQLFSACGEKVLAAASTVQKDVRGNAKHGGNKEAAALVGRAIGKKTLDHGIKKIAFDRSGYKYHGCVKALADAVREVGVEF